MSKSFKEKVKENKGKILTGVIFGAKAEARLDNK